MKTKLIVTIAVIFSLTTSLSFAQTRYIESFSRSKVGNFPKSWRTRPGQKGKAKEVYKVQEEGENKYLAADDPDGKSVQIFRLASWNVEKYPLLKWKWRARKLPAGANETIPAKNDSACGIYISFGMLRGNALKYVWSTTAPKETFYKKNDKMTIIVKETGSPGRWVYESTNLQEDAKRAFGKVPDRTLSGVAILTDGNATHTPTACDYDSIGYAALPAETPEEAAKEEPTNL
jgi:hypothetical protein